MTQILEPISLGYACDVKYQASRNLYWRAHPQGSEEAFRNYLFRVGGRKSPFTRHIFDWAITSYAAVRAYLEQDFEGVFEREDLLVAKDGTTVKHRRLHAYFPHDFRGGSDGQITEAMLDEQYGVFRSKHEYLAQRFRDLLKSSGPYLYIYKEILPQNDVDTLIGLLRRHPEHQFQMLLVDTEGAVNQMLMRTAAPVSKGWLPSVIDKPPARSWEGDDTAWDAVLNRFTLGLEPQAVEAQPLVAERAPVAVPALKPPRRGWRSLLEMTGPQGYAEVLHHVSARGDGTGLVGEGDRMVFDGPHPDDHFFCQLIPVDPVESQGWARLVLRWPATPEPRAYVALQDQDGFHPAADSVAAKPSPGWVQETQVFPLKAGTDHVRLVIMPFGEERSQLPDAIRLEVAEAPPAAPWPYRLMDRFRALRG